MIRVRAVSVDRVKDYWFAAPDAVGAEQAEGASGRE